jgi:UDP-glucose 4-epimerase
MKILIIGGSGFIGSNAITYFENQGHEVYAVDVVPSAHPKSYLIQKMSDCEQIFSAHQFEVCINASGLANVQVSFQEPMLDFELNVQNVYILLNLLKKYNSQCKFINFSSAAVYGNPITLPIKETFTSKPLSPYGAHKQYSEQIGKEFYDFFGIPTCSLRVFSAYGLGLKKQIFWDMYHKFKANEHINLFGTGTETRDFIHIDDLLFALDRIIQCADFKGEVINVANGKAISIAEVSTVFASFFPTTKNIIFNQQIKQGDPLYWVADIALLSSYGYTPKIDITKGLAQYYNWVSKL